MGPSQQPLETFLHPCKFVAEFSGVQSPGRMYSSSRRRSSISFCFSSLIMSSMAFTSGRHETSTTEGLYKASTIEGRPLWPEHMVLHSSHPLGRPGWGGEGPLCRAFVEGEEVAWNLVPCTPRNNTTVYNSNSKNNNDIKEG